ncbi:alpha/beta fold hydrolase [Pusillimonas noertemannii]|uniref:Pimeloyl-ACP methyl ester carboxylesterase n=1 Tax=Pusillimonas noertemannii TaxID=305977 RepID=A0A2U1CR03_9BURK|nr:alpha/beta hydrolase [Pusillimonas noertemannii]NYT67592.1 alpha/beta hydrolase [Pusillimonas noertemannii]PVY68264.1 pimeloyl-ACP methyl ester carboxylesterase [Pusillimonas noertemannii]TFL12242.1 alpha/beta hydrolase [Pusillimonas noertemannii]
MNLWKREGGEGGARRLVLIHGLGANADVWLPLQDKLHARWLAPDLRGHGRSPHRRHYGFASYASDVAELLEQDEEIDVVGHSLGGVVGMALGTGWFGVKVRRVLAFGVKTQWTADEIARSRALANNPVKLFDTREQAVERYLKVSGLSGLVPPSSEVAKNGVSESENKWRLAADPFINAIADLPVARLVGAMQCPLRMAAGSEDPMTTASDMALFDSAAGIIEGAGHNVHVEKPVDLCRWIQQSLI